MEIFIILTQAVSIVFLIGFTYGKIITKIKIMEENQNKFETGLNNFSKKLDDHLINHD
jgi:hypothetical protein